MMNRVVNNEGAFGKYIMQELKLPAVHATPEAVADYEAAGKKRIHWMDGDNMPGSIQINTSWYLRPGREYQLNLAEKANVYNTWQSHTHDADEIVCYYGTDPEHPYDLCGEIEMMIGDELHVLTKSSMIYIPAGLSHSTPLVNRVDRPIFHFSLVLTKKYGFLAESGESFLAE